MVNRVIIVLSRIRLLQASDLSEHGGTTLALNSSSILYGVPSHTAAVWPIRILATRRIIKRVRQYLK